jgi:hypothetical protein
MNRSILRSEVLPFSLWFGLLLVATAIADVLLHSLHMAWVGRWLGIPGTVLIVASFAYSLRKRGVVALGKPADLLEQHEHTALLGALLLLVHAGTQVHAILPWLAVAAMLVNVLSGLTGRMLLRRARERVAERGEALRNAGRTPAEVDRELFWDAVAIGTMKQWRAAHFPITTAFVVLALAHITSALLLWNWR